MVGGRDRGERLRQNSCGPPAEMGSVSKQNLLREVLDLSACKHRHVEYVQTYTDQCWDGSSKAGLLIH